MPKGTLPERFATILLGELASMNALLLCLTDYAIIDTAKRSGQSVDEITKAFSEKQKRLSDETYAELLRKLNLTDKGSSASK